MKKVLFLMLTLIVMSAAGVNAQVKIGGDGIANPVPGAVLELEGNGALLLPRVNALSVIASPVKGMLVYLTQTDGANVADKVYVYDGTWNVYAGTVGPQGPAGATGPQGPAGESATAGTLVTTATTNAKITAPTSTNAAITLHDVARTGSYNDLLNKPTIPETPDLSNYAPKVSPELTGTPTAPTATATTNNTQIATTAYVTAAVKASGPVGPNGYSGECTWYQFTNASGAGVTWGSTKLVEKCIPTYSVANWTRSSPQCYWNGSKFMLAQGTSALSNVEIPAGWACVLVFD
ncbi:MAG: hypothetical protein LBO74_13425 [Candidatus Symbiothrix sp.]|nr:hypothetical protein [Candidatus Symbiothrix sp.]